MIRAPLDLKTPTICGKQLHQTFNQIETVLFITISLNQHLPIIRLLYEQILG